MCVHFKNIYDGFIDDTSGRCYKATLKYLRERQHTPVSHTRNIPKPQNDSGIPKQKLLVGGWFWYAKQGSVGKFLENILQGGFSIKELSSESETVETPGSQQKHPAI